MAKKFREFGACDRPAISPVLLWARFVDRHPPQLGAVVLDFGFVWAETYKIEVAVCKTKEPAPSEQIGDVGAPSSDVQAVAVEDGDVPVGQVGFRGDIVASFMEDSDNTCDLAPV